MPTVRPSSCLEIGQIAAAASGSSKPQMINWIDNFEIPWSKCPDTLMSALDIGNPPSERDLRQLVTHTVSDLFVFTRRASRHQLRSVARKIVKRSPQSFADFINGRIVSDGVDSLMLMLEAKKENLNRRESLTSDKKNAPTKTATKRSNNSYHYGCQQRQVPLPVGETGEIQEVKRLELCRLYEHQRDSLKVARLMEQTFASQREIINAKMQLCEVLIKWPFLGLARPILEHLRQLTGVDIEVSLRAAIGRKSQNIFDFFDPAAASSNGGSLQQYLNEAKAEVLLTGSKLPLIDFTIFFIMAYFREDAANFIHFDKV
jgi:hypothetical protein